MPVIVVKGARVGRVVGITAAIHGNEINGTKLRLGIHVQLRVESVSTRVLFVSRARRCAGYSQRREEVEPGGHVWHARGGPGGQHARLRVVPTPVRPTPCARARRPRIGQRRISTVFDRFGDRVDLNRVMPGKASTGSQRFAQALFNKVGCPRSPHVRRLRHELLTIRGRR